MTEQFVEQHSVVSFVYSIVDESGELLEQSDLPISYVHGGKHELFEKVEQALDGAVVNDTVEVSLTPAEGFGPHDPDFVGAEVEMMNDQGDSRKFTVTRIADGKLTVDGNHPMAGKVITFRIKVTDIRDATPEEIARGVEAMAMPVLH